MEDKIYFVIDTDRYSGNFERQMCAYITGQIGECGVGDEIAKHANKELEALGGKDLASDFESLIISEPDEHGCWRPAKIYPTEGWHNNGMGFHYRDGEEEEAIEEFRKSCKEYGDKQHYRTDATAQREHKDRWYDKADNAETECGRFPAYQSVAICLFEKPSGEMITLMKNRAEEFAHLCREGETETVGGDKWLTMDLNITGYRLVMEEVAVKTEQI